MQLIGAAFRKPPGSDNKIYEGRAVAVIQVEIQGRVVQRFMLFKLFYTALGKTLAHRDVQTLPWGGSFVL